MNEIGTPCLTLCVPSNEAEDLSFSLSDLGALSVEIKDDTTLSRASSGLSELVAGFDDPDSRDRCIAAMRDARPELRIEALDVTDESWRNGWRAYFERVALTRIEVITPWMEPSRPDLIPVVINPGQAFGTGGHATTKTVLGMLETRRLPMRILDVGTGSGVLAITAARLGATDVTAIDIDPEAISATRDNVSANGVGGSVTAIHEPPSKLEGTWPLVLANLELSIFLEFGDDVAARIAPGGTLLASGLFVDQVDSFMALMPEFRIVDQMEDDGWSALALERKQ